MATGPRDKPEPIREADVQGLKYFRKLWPLFEQLRDVGCQRDKAGNRQLFLDQYCALVLLFLFCLYRQGWADREELLAHLQQLTPQAM